MTTIANKHGLRANATAKRKKHDQRTPLPPRPGQVEAAREVIGEDDMASVIKRIQSQKDTKSWTKAKMFMEGVAQHGWKTTAGTPENTGEADHIEVKAQRGTEFIYIEWINGVYQPGATYTIADRTVRLRNASAAKQYASRSTEDAEQELNRVATNKSFRRKATPEGEIKRRPLPFDPGLATDAEVIEAVRGRAIRWHNRYRETAETAMVGTSGGRLKHVHITTYAGERILNFLCPTTGFRSCYLSAITAVGKGERATKGQIDAGVEPVALVEEVSA